jgi:hypothetical protein
MVLPDSTSMVKIKPNKPARKGGGRPKTGRPLMTNKLVAPCTPALFATATRLANATCKGNRAQLVRNLVEKYAAEIDAAPVTE